MDIAKMIRRNNSFLFKLDILDVIDFNSYEGSVGREFYKEFSSDSPRDSKGKMRSLRVSERGSRILNKK